MSEDPIGFAGGDTNLYRYAGGSYPNATDPTGHVSTTGTGGDGPGLWGRLLAAVGSGENAASGLLFGARQLADEARGGLKGLKEVRQNNPWMGILTGPADALTGGMLFDAAVDLAAAVPA